MAIRALRATSRRAACRTLNRLSMKKTLVAVCALAQAMAMTAQDSDPVIMTINGQPVTRSEFTYSYNKNNADGVMEKKSVKDYVPMFVNFKLKVMAAQDARLDTVRSIANELRSYKEQLVLSSIADSAFMEEQARHTYEMTAKRFEGQDLITASHILVRLRQDATAGQQKAAKDKIDSIYAALQGGADFAQLAKDCSDDKASAVKGGALGQFGKGMMIPDFENAAYSLSKGETSKPVLSTVGYHIIKVTDRHPFEPYEYHRGAIMKFLEQRGVRQTAANARIDTLAKRSGLKRSEQVEQLFDSIAAADSDTRYLAQEYREGTLMYEVSKREVWDKAAQDEAGLAAYFAKNKKRYKWDGPRFRGIVIHAKSDDILASAKKTLKGVAEEDWAKTLIGKYNTDSLKQVRIERGVYKQGDNKNVDHYAFKTGEPQAMKDFPATGVQGTMLKKPKTYRDVKGNVTSDYQAQKESEWVEQLKTKYEVKVNQDVLSTVKDR